MFTIPKKPLTRVSKRVPARGLERGRQKRLAKGWRSVGEGLAQGWRKVGKGLAGFLAPSNIAISEAPVYKSGFVTPWYSLSKSTGEWFTNHSNHIHKIIPITQNRSPHLVDFS